MRGGFGLAKIRSSGFGNPTTQTLEYKGFGGEKARNLPGAVIPARANDPLPSGKFL
jgi:hypothetical protein